MGWPMAILNFWRRLRPVSHRPEIDVTGVREQRVGASVVKVGRFTYGDQLITIRQWGEGAHLTIGSFCSLATGMKVFLGGNHRTDWVTTYPFGHAFQDHLGPPVVGHPATRGDIVIGNDVWIGEGVTILSGVTIGDGAVVAARAVVSKSIGPYEVWGGNPARLIRRRFSDEIVRELLALRWWDMDLNVIKAIIPLLCDGPTPETLASMHEAAASRRVGQARALPPH